MNNESGIIVIIEMSSNDGQMMVKYPDFALIVFRAVMKFFNFMNIYRLVLQRVKKVPSAIKKSNKCMA